MKTFAVVLSCVFGFAVLAKATPIAIQSDSPDSATWVTDDSQFFQVNFSLTSNPGSVFSTTTFGLYFWADDRPLQSSRPFGDILLATPGDLLISTVFMREDDVIDGNVSYNNSQAQFLVLDSLQNNALSGTDNYLGISWNDATNNVHYGWLQLALSQFSNGSIAIDYLGGYVESTADTSIAAGAVPEPSTWMLVGLGTGVFFLIRGWRFCVSDR